MKIAYIIVFAISLSAGNILAQNVASFLNSTGDTLLVVREDGQVIIGAAVENGNAILDIDALNNDKGIRIPRLSTTQRIAMSSALGTTDDGLLLYDETANSFWYWSGDQWNTLGASSDDNLGNHIAIHTIDLNNHFLSGDGNNEGIFIDTSGNVGIGVTAPAYKLDVAGNIKVANDDPTITFFEDGGNDEIRKSAIQNSLSTASSDPADQKMIFGISNGSNTGTGMNNVLTLTGEGNIGIGTTTPTSRLDVVASTNDPLVIFRNNGDDDARVLQVVSSTSGSGPIFQVQQALSVMGNGHVGIGTTLSSSTSKLNVFGSGNLANFTRLGIGTTEPLAPLHIENTTTISSFSGNNNGGAWMYQASGAGSDEIGYAQDAGSTEVSIYADHSIVALGDGVFVAANVNWSDERIKHIIGVSDAKQALETIDRIRITDYHRIDGGKKEKKVIAQQLREVFPQAVSLQEGVIPNIYTFADQFEYDAEHQLLTIVTPGPHDLTVGDQIDYFTEQERVSRQDVIAVLSANAFQVKAASPPRELFVYGKWVPDVHAVDYDAVSMLNVSATQGLHHIMELQQQRIAELKARNARLACQNNAFEKRFADLEAALQQQDGVNDQSEK